MVSYPDHVFKRYMTQIAKNEVLQFYLTNMLQCLPITILRTTSIFLLLSGAASYLEHFFGPVTVIPTPTTTGLSPSEAVSRSTTQETQYFKRTQMFVTVAKTALN
jgi:hypothetical protein